MFECAGSSPDHEVDDVRDSAGVDRTPATVADDPMGQTPCAVAFRKQHCRELAPMLVTAAVEPTTTPAGVTSGESSDAPNDLDASRIATALNIVARAKRKHDGAAAAEAIFVYRRALATDGASPWRVERGALAAVVEWIALDDSRKTRLMFGMSDDAHFGRTLTLLASELLADALLAWDRWVTKWNQPPRRKGRRPRLRHSAFFMSVPDAAKLTGLNERTLRRRCERQELPAEQRGRGWFIDFNACVSAESEAAKILLQRYHLRKRQARP